MLKRKRDNSDDGEDQDKLDNDVEVHRRRKRAGEKIAHGKKLLNHALKTARGFERQKLGRRHKTAVEKRDRGEVARIDAEIEALKALDLPLAAESYICKTLLKIKSIASSPALPSAVHNFKRPPSDNATANVCARLYNSNPFKQTVPAILGSIQKALRLTSPDATVKEKAIKTERPKSIGASTDGGSADGRDLTSEDGREEGATLNRARNKLEPLRSRTVNGGGGQNENDEEDEGTISQLDARIASSSGEGSDFEDSAPTDTQLRNGSIEATFNSTSPSASASASESPPPLKRKKLPKQAAVFASGATYLPGLSNVGYVSGSESEAEDDIDIAPRKNRRGQRARQQLWEKKYGARAKHLQKRARQNDNRDKDWDPIRGARNGDKLGRRGRTGNSIQPSSTKDANDLPSVPRKNARKDNEGPLHPSWEAAKKAKEQKITAAFQGKKVIFT